MVADVTAASITLEQRECGRRAWLVPAVPGVAGLLVPLWGIRGPSLWRDEAATIVVARQPFAGMVRILTHIDAVHAAYYTLMHFVVAVLGQGEAAVRLPSAMGVSAAAAGTALLGRRLAGSGTGVAAGLVLAGSPIVSRFGQEARSYTIVMALAVWATYLLVRAVERETRRAFAGYAAGVAVLGLGHVFALLLLLAHALIVSRYARALAGRWAVAVLAASAVVSPTAAVAVGQRAVVDWIVAPTRGDLSSLAAALAGSALLVPPVAVLAGYGLARRSPEGTIDLRELAGAWLVVPPAVLLGVSLLHPYYQLRYVLICLPAAALLAGMGLARLRKWVMVVVIVVMVSLAVPAHLDWRKETSRPDNLRGAARILRKHPGDALVFGVTAYRRVAAAYPRFFGRMNDIALAVPAGKAGNLTGTEVAPEELRRRVLAVRQVWLIDPVMPPGVRPTPADRAKRSLFGSSLFTPAGRWRFKGGSLTLYERNP